MDTLDYTLFLFKLVAAGLLLGLVLVVGLGLWLDRDKTPKQPKWRERITRRR